LAIKWLVAYSEKDKPITKTMDTIKALLFSVLLAAYSFVVAMSYYWLLFKQLISAIGNIVLIVLVVAIGVFAPIVVFASIMPRSQLRDISVVLWAILWGVPSIFVRIRILKR